MSVTSRPRLDRSADYSRPDTAHGNLGSLLVAPQYVSSGTLEGGSDAALRSAGRASEESEGTMHAKAGMAHTAPSHYPAAPREGETGAEEGRGDFPTGAEQQTRRPSSSRASSRGYGGRMHFLATTGTPASVPMSEEAAMQAQAEMEVLAQAATETADHHAALATQLLEAAEAVLDGLTLPSESSPSATAGTDAATLALSARTVAALGILEAGMSPFKASHGQVVQVLVANLRSAVVKPQAGEALRVLSDTAAEAEEGGDWSTVRAVNTLLHFPAALAELVEGVMASVHVAVGCMTGHWEAGFSPADVRLITPPAELKAAAARCLADVLQAQETVSAALARRLQLDTTSAAVAAPRRSPLRDMERHLVLAAAAPTHAAEAARLAVLAEQQCTYLEGLEAAKDKLEMMTAKTQRIINSTAVRLQGALLARYFTVWAKQTRTSKRQLSALGAMLRRQSRVDILRACFDAIIREGRLHKVARLTQGLRDLQNAVTRESTEREASVLRVQDLEGQRLALLDELDRLKRTNQQRTIELERATALQRVLPEANLRRMAGAWLVTADKVFEGQIAVMSRQVETLAGGMAPEVPPGVDAPTSDSASAPGSGGAQGSGGAPRHKKPKRMGAEMFPPRARGARENSGSDRGWEGQNLVNPLLLLTDKELAQCRARAAALDGFGQQPSRPTTEDGRSSGRRTGSDRQAFDGGSLPPLPPLEAEALRLLCALPLDILLLRWSNHHLLNANGAVWQDWWRVWMAEAEAMRAMPPPGVESPASLRALDTAVPLDAAALRKADPGTRLVQELVRVGYVHDPTATKASAGAGGEEPPATEDAPPEVHREEAVEASLAAALGEDQVEGASTAFGLPGSPLPGAATPGLSNTTAGGYVPAASHGTGSRLGLASQEPGEGGMGLESHILVAGTTVRLYRAMARIRKRAARAAAAAAGQPEGMDSATGVSSTGGGATGFGAADMGTSEAASAAPLFVVENVGDDWRSGHCYALLLHRLSSSNAFGCAQHVTMGTAPLLDMPYVLPPKADQAGVSNEAPSQAGDSVAVRIPGPRDIPSPWRAVTLGRLHQAGVRGAADDAARLAEAEEAFTLHRRGAGSGPTPSTSPSSPRYRPKPIAMRLPPAVPIIGFPPVTPSPPLTLVPTQPHGHMAPEDRRAADPHQSGLSNLADIATGAAMVHVGAAGGHAAYAELFRRAGLPQPPPDHPILRDTAKLAPWLHSLLWPTRLLGTLLPHPPALRILPYTLRHVDDEGRAEEVVARMARLGVPQGLLEPWHITAGQSHVAAHLTALAYMFCRWPELRAPLGWVSAVREAPELAVKDGGDGSIANEHPGVRVQTAWGKRVPLLVPFAWLPSAPQGTAGSSPGRAPATPASGAFDAFAVDAGEGKAATAHTPHSTLHLPPPHLALQRTAEETVAAVAGAISVGDDIMLAHPLTLKRVAEVTLRLRAEWWGFLQAYTAHVHRYHAHVAFAEAQQAAMAAARRKSAAAAVAQGSARTLGSARRSFRASSRGSTPKARADSPTHRSRSPSPPPRKVLRPPSVKTQEQAPSPSSSGGAASVEGTSAWLGVRLNMSAVNTFAAALGYVQGVIERAISTRRVRWGMWVRLREHVQAATWSAMRRRGAGLPMHIVDRREQRCLRSVTQTPLMLVPDVAPTLLHTAREVFENTAGSPRALQASPTAADGGGTTPKSRASTSSKKSGASSGSALAPDVILAREAAMSTGQETALRALQQCLAPQLQRWYALLKRVFQYYAAAEEGGSSTAMDWKEWMHLCRECRLVRADAVTALKVVAKRPGAKARSGGGAGMGTSAVMVSAGGRSVTVARPTDAASGGSTLPESGLSLRELQLVFVASLADASERGAAMDQLVAAAGDRMWEPEHELRQSEFVGAVLRLAVAYYARERAIQRMRDRLAAANAAAARASALAEALGLNTGSKGPLRAGALSVAAKLQLGTMTHADVAELRRTRPDVFRELLKRGAVTKAGEVVTDTSSGKSPKGPGSAGGTDGGSGKTSVTAPSTKPGVGVEEATSATPASAAEAPKAPGLLTGRKAKGPAALGSLDRDTAFRLRLTHGMGMGMLHPPSEAPPAKSSGGKSPRSGSRGRSAGSSRPRTPSRPGTSDSRPSSRGTETAAANISVEPNSGALDEAGDLEMLGSLAELSLAEVAAQVDEWVGAVYAAESLESDTIKGTVHPCGALEAMLRFHIERMACKSSANAAEWKADLRRPGVRTVLAKYKPQLSGIYLMYVRQQAEQLLAELEGGSSTGSVSKGMVDSVVASGAGAMSVADFIHLLRVCGLLAGTSITGRTKARSVASVKLGEVDILAALVRVTQANVDALYEGDDEEHAAPAKDTSGADSAGSPRSKRGRRSPRHGGGSSPRKRELSVDAAPVASSAAALYARCDKNLARLLLTKEQRARWRRVHGAKAQATVGNVAVVSGMAASAAPAPRKSPRGSHVPGTPQDRPSPTGTGVMWEDEPTMAPGAPALVELTPTSELSYTAFVECLVALAITLMPSPYVPLETKLDTFMSKYILTGFAAVTEGGSTTSLGKTAN